VPHLSASVWSAMALAAGTFTRHCSPPPGLRVPRRGHHLTERRRQVAADLACPAFASLQELASAGADAVAISTPAATTSRSPSSAAPGPGGLLRQAVRAGRRLRRQAVELAGQLGVPLTVYQNAAGLGLPDPARAARQRIAGELTVFESRFERFRPTPARPRPAAAPCWTSAATWPIRPWCSRSVSGVYAEMHYRSEPGGWMTTFSSR